MIGVWCNWIGDSLASAPGGGEECLNIYETPGGGAGEREEGTNGPVRYG